MTSPLQVKLGNSRGIDRVAVFPRTRQTFLRERAASSSLIFRLSPTALPDGELTTSAREVTHGSPTSDHIDAEASLNGKLGASSASRNRRDLSLCHKNARPARRNSLSLFLSVCFSFESTVRLRTCHSCREIINKRHPVPAAYI